MRIKGREDNPSLPFYVLSLICNCIRFVFKRDSLYRFDKDTDISSNSGKG